MRLELLNRLPEDALAVLAQVHLAADVDPFGGASGFETQLVERGVVDEPIKGFCKVRHHDIGGFAFEVLRVWGSSDGLV